MTVRVASSHRPSADLFHSEEMEKDMQVKHCAACGLRFEPRLQTPHQTYCSARSCQSERRRKWQENKIKNDPDYKENQARAQQAWSKRHADYWRNYRNTHVEYTKQNRILQWGRNNRPSKGSIAKMDASNSLPMPMPGLYRLNFITDSGIAKMDAWTVELRVISYFPVAATKITKR
jgi:hypothetical protein